MSRWKERITITTPKGRTKLETDKAYDKFCYFRDLGETRTYVKVAEKYCINVKTVKLLAKKYDWKNRISEMVDAEKEQERKKTLKRKNATKKKHRDVGAKEQEKILKLIQNIYDNSEMSDDEKAKAVAPLYTSYAKMVEVERTANNLPVRYNDKQKVEANTEISGELKLHNRLLFADKKSYQKTINELEDLLE